MTERRLLVAAGTAEYRHLSGSELSQVPNEIKRIIETLKPLQYELCLCDLSLNPPATQLQDRLPRWLQQEVREGDLIVLYYSGHGVRDGDSFYLLTSDSEDGLFDSTAISAEQLARWMIKQAKAAQILVILDACYAGAGAADFVHIAGKICAMISQGPAVAVIAAARSKQEAQQGAFSSALAAALANDDGRLGGSTQQFLAFDEVMERIDRYFVERHPTQTATWSSVNTRGRLRFFPNQNFNAFVSPGWDLELQTTFRNHWFPKAMSTEATGRAWYFTGRTQALRDIVSWLHNDNDAGTPRVCVVTGGAGSGKSALLARIVTLADPIIRESLLTPQALQSLAPETIPSINSISIALHLRKKRVADVVKSMTHALDLPLADTREPSLLIEEIGKHPSRLAILIDALDEATEHEAIVSEVVRPLSQLTHVKLLIGTRPDRPADIHSEGHRFLALGECTLEIDLDRGQYYDPQDVANYITRRLMALEEPGRITPYQGKPELTRTVAQALSERAGQVFLVARTAALSLLSQPEIVDTTQPAWIEGLPTGVQEAFRQFLSSFDGQPGWSYEKAIAILRPLAFAEGEGLPWTTIWATLASALSGTIISCQEITQLRDQAAAFIIEASEEGRSVYRLYHESLAEWLRAEAGDPIDTHRQITEALYALVPKVPGTEEVDWARAHPYILTYLPIHAQTAGILATVCLDSSFVVHANPRSLAIALQQSNDRGIQSLRAIYLLTFDRLVQSLPSERAAYLGLIAHQQNEPELVDRFSRLNLSNCWSCNWTKGGMVVPHRTLAKLPCGIAALALIEVTGCPIAIIGTANGIYCIDAITGGLRGNPWYGHTGYLRAIASIVVNGRPMVISAGDDKTLRRWDLETGKPIGEPLIGHAGGINALALGLVDGRPVAVSGGDECVLRFWDLKTGLSLAEVATDPHGWVKAVAMGIVNGRAIVMSGHDGVLCRWDLGSGELIGESIHFSSETS